VTRTRLAAAAGHLGSGNQFIEVSFDEDEQVWLFLHSGSRGIGDERQRPARLGDRHRAHVHGILPPR
jgi:RNA-splicing ligase RtcB